MESFFQCLSSPLSTFLLWDTPSWKRKWCLLVCLIVLIFCLAFPLTHSGRPKYFTSLQAEPTSQPALAIFFRTCNPIHICTVIYWNCLAIPSSTFHINSLLWVPVMTALVRLSLSSTRALELFPLIFLLFLRAFLYHSRSSC